MYSSRSGLIFDRSPVLRFSLSGGDFSVMDKWINLLTLHAARKGALLFGLCFSEAASAHSFGKLYNLPVPFWMYLYGAAAALVLSFLIVGYFVNAKAERANLKVLDLSRYRFVRFWVHPATILTLRVLTVALLALTILSGFIGSRNPYLNFNMTWFWILFVLGFSYLVSLIGNVYDPLNPWRAVVEAIEKWRPTLFAGRIRYAEAWGYYPALGFYMAFIWIELFAHSLPFSLSVILASYTALNIAGAWLVGKQAWFRYCEFFGVMLWLISLCAPLERLPGPGRSVVLRQPFIGLLKEKASHFSLLLFVLFMLSSTAYDGIHETLPWVKIFWKDIYQGVLKFIVGDNIVKSYPTLQLIYKVWQTATLMLSPLVYLVLYWLCLWLARKLTRSQLPLRQLMLNFTLSLIPIAFVYNITHYYTLIITQGGQIIRLISDPFGWGWNLFGTAKWMTAAVTPDASFVWHSQVALILLGHIVSVYLAHLVALRVFPTQRQATLSQIPMLFLMVIYTTMGLWILSQPITSGQIFVPTAPPK